MGLAGLLAQTGQTAVAEAEYREAMTIQQELADDNRAAPGFRSSLASGHHDLGLLLKETGRPAPAEAEYRKALAIQQELVKDNPGVIDLRKPGDHPQ